jgi:hypothetical protein
LQSSNEAVNELVIANLGALTRFVSP